jgi:hypothetical protein
VIYETHCFGTHDPISLDYFDDTDEINNGEITIIPKYNEYKIINNCFFTEELYMSLLNNIGYYGNQDNNIPLNHPIYRTRFTRNDVEHIVNQLLIKLEKDKDSADEEAKAKSFAFVKEIINQEYLKVVVELEIVNGIKPIKDALLNLTKLKTFLDKLIEYLEKPNPNLKILLEKTEFKNFIDKTLEATLEATKRAITKEDKKLDLDIEKAKAKDEQATLKKLQEKKQKNHLNESREQIFKFFHLFDINKIDKVESKTLDKLAIIDIYSFYLGINFGTESNKIILFCRFNDNIKEEANCSFLDVPVFN